MATALVNNGYKSEKPWRDALRVAVNARADGRGSPKRLAVIAERCAVEAMAGESWAVREIGDRLDGKPAQAITGDPDSPLQLGLTLDAHELARRIAYMLDMAARAPAQLEVLDIPLEIVDIST